MKLIEYFKSFLTNEVNLNSDRLRLLDERTQTISEFLKNSELLKENFLDTIPQGSYAHKTIIKPVQETDEFDADILLYLREFEGWEACDYIEKVYKLFKNSGTYKDMVYRKSRCLTVDYANDFHIDIVPFLERHSNKHITNRIENNFQLTNPEGYNEWLDEKNRTANNNFVKVIRLIKYLRDYKNTFSVKSIILNTVIGNQINDAALLENENSYADIPTTLNTVMQKVKSYVEFNYNLPVISDPSETGENFSDRWTQEGYLNFRKWMIYYSGKIKDAYEEQNLEKSIEKWQLVFGDEFKKVTSGNNKSLDKVDSALIKFTNTEQQLSDINIPLLLNPKFALKIQGNVSRNGFRDYILSFRGNTVVRQSRLRFVVKRCTVPEPYKIFWKVLNRGKEAMQRDCIRGQIVEGSETRYETTNFIGPHSVECFIVKNGVCVAKDRQEVRIN